MSKQALEKIAAGLNEAIDLAIAERLTGIPASTLAGLRDGRLVAVDRVFLRNVQALLHGSENEAHRALAEVATDLLAAAPEAPDAQV